MGHSKDRRLEGQTNGSMGPQSEAAEWMETVSGGSGEVNQRWITHTHRGLDQIWSNTAWKDTTSGEMTQRSINPETTQRKKKGGP